MPILDPILQFNLLSISYQDRNKKFSAHPKCFYYNQLLIAKDLINLDSRTIIASIQFKKDIHKFISIIPKYFDEKNPGFFDLKKINDIYDEHPNIYYTLLKNIDCAENENDENVLYTGKFYQYSFFNTNFNFVKIFAENLVFRSWFLSDTPIVILCLHLNEITNDDFKMLLFEIDLFYAMGYFMILCISNFENCKFNDFEQLIEILYTHLFTEIHVTFDSDNYDANFHDFIKILIKNYEKFNSYFYFYTRYFYFEEEDGCFRFQNPTIVLPLINPLTRKKSEKIISFNNTNKTELINDLEILKKLPRLQLFNFSDPINESLITQNLVESEQFTVCPHGLYHTKLKVIFSNAPLYNNKDDLHSCEFTNIDKYKSCGIINVNNFLFKEKARIKIETAYLDQKKETKYIKKYVDFDDMHYINPELYVKNQLSLIKSKNYIKEKCNSFIYYLRNGAVTKDFTRIKVKSNPAIELIDEVIKSALYNYKIYHNKSNTNEFEYHLNQIYTIYEIVESCFNKYSKSSGLVYQIPTGEGKSAIISIVAAILAKLNKKVHIVTSNIHLSNRDYNNSFDYFKNLNLISTVLLHLNEIPDFTEYYTKKSNYPNNFFGNELFNNPMQMNFIVCDDKMKANIIFSTISNFECNYLYMTEKINAAIDDYYKNAVLLIDEADSILIDEITNGTIISRPIKSNANEVLSFLYNNYINGKKNAEQLKDAIQKKWPECSDLNINDINIMIKEIELIIKNDTKFVENKKYIIQNDEIIPFDFDNKGIIEKNKEYSGFIEQFIAIKEQYNGNKKVNIKDISLNYLYISHPIYVKLYNKVFGLTGTLGDVHDKQLILKHYNLKSKIIPKEYPNRCCHFPTIICNNIIERNNLIVNEVLDFNQKGFPVLVILLSPDEINEINKLIIDKSKSQLNIKIFDGKDTKIRLGNNSGVRKAITLGTNVCGRGMHIEVNEKHLHVIIGFYSSNKRILDQAYGRTSRKDKFGSVHIFCLNNELRNVNKFYNDKEVETAIKRFEIFKNKQQEFINEFQKKGWIFDLNLNYTKKLTVSERQNLRYPKININRSVICDYKYPICMSHKTFLKIQEQKIFSLINCPNCKYTWQLFQQYIREMILESWSIFINKSEKKFDMELLTNKEIECYLNNGKNRLIAELDSYFFNNRGEFDIFNTFYNIFKKVNCEYEPLIKSIFRIVDSKDRFIDDDNTEIMNFNFIHKKDKKNAKISRISFEFRPFQLIERSGSRINKLRGKIEYISDPELKYKRAKSDNPISITEVLDSIFDKICNIINNFLEEHLKFKLFLRRTLAGCEFGLCYDFNADIQIDDEFCLIDKNVFLIFSININSPIPFLAGVLIFMAIYLLNIIKKLISIFQELIKDLSKVVIKVFKQILEYVKKRIIDDSIEKIYEKIIDKLKESIYEIIDKFKNLKPKHYYIIRMLTDILVNKMIDKYDDVNEEFTDKVFTIFKCQIKKKIKIEEPIKESSSFLFKLGFLSVLWLVSHMINFHFNFLFNDKLTYNKDVEKYSKDLQKNHTPKNIDDFIESNDNKVMPCINDLRIHSNFSNNLSLLIQGILNE